MSYAVFLQINENTMIRFQDVHQKLQQHASESQSKALGKVLSDISCEVIEQVFTVLLKQDRNTTQLSDEHLAESEKVIQQILDALRKYMPWSVSFFSNERLLPLVNYLSAQMYQKDQQSFIFYPIESTLAVETLALVERIQQGELQWIETAFDQLIQIVDQGVTCLIRRPKETLNFNFVVDKTLNGVINMTTHIGYKRLEKLGRQVDASTSTLFINHFMAFLRKQA